MDIIFMFDVVLNFFIAYVDSDLEVITDHKRIAREYLTSWFLVDLLGGFPVDWCFPVTWEALSQWHADESRDVTAASGLGLLKTVKLSKCVFIT